MFFKVKRQYLMFISIFLFCFFLVNFTCAKDSSDFIKNELNIKFKSTTNADRVVNKHGAKLDEKNSTINVGKVKLQKDSYIKNELLKFKNDASVEYVEPNYPAKATMIADDTYYSKQWALPKIEADDAWDITTGNDSTIIAIVDTGVDSDHPDLKNNLVSGYNTINNSTNTNDDNGHGTHVAGIAAGVINNATGIAGVAGSCKIMPIKALNSEGSGYYSDIAEGIVWAADHDAKVINLSLGGPYYSQTLQDAINYAYSKGAVVIAAAGNDNTDEPHYPAANDHVIGISATTETNSKAWFSNYGDYIDLAAPGTDIYSSTFNGSYGYMQGTSMSCPHVSGVSALLLSAYPSLDPTQAEYTMESTAKDLGVSGRDDYFGYGLIDALSSLTKPMDSSPISLTLYGDSPDPFRRHARFTYAITKDGFVTLKIYDENNNLVRTLLNSDSKNPGTYYTTWTGRNDNGDAVSSGSYKYVLQAQDYLGNVSDPFTGTINIDRTRPQISNISLSSDPFAPNGTNSEIITYDLSKASRVKARVYDYYDNSVKTLTYYDSQAAGSNSITWSGKNYEDQIVNDGTYNLKIYAIDNLGNRSFIETKEITVEKDTPQITNVSYELSDNTNNFIIKYTASEKVTATLKIYDENNNLVRRIVQSDVRGDNSFAWDQTDDSGDLVEDGTYTYKINATDSFGNVAQEKSGTIKTNNREPVILDTSIQPDLFDPKGTIYYSISEDAVITTKIFDNAKELVKVLEDSVSREQGSYSVDWNGINNEGVEVSDGDYTCKISIVDVEGLKGDPVNINITVERLNPFITNVSTTQHNNGYDFKYSLSEDSITTIDIYNVNNNLVKTLTNESTKGENTISWDGKAENGDLVGDGVYTYKIKATDAFGNTSEQISGEIEVNNIPPTVSDVKVSPDLFDPDGTITYTLSDKAKVNIGIYYSGNKIKTLEKDSLKQAGQNSTVWDGTSSQDEHVPDGSYEFKISAVDSDGLVSETYKGKITVERLNPVIKNVIDQPTTDNLGETVIKYTISEKADVTFRFFDSSGNLVRTLNFRDVNRGENKAVWDGKDENGQLVIDGSYEYSINAVDMFGNPAEQVSGTVIKDTTSPSISNVNLSPSVFDPDGSLLYTLSETARVTTTIYDQSDNLIKVLEKDELKDGGDYTVAWDGTNKKGVKVVDGEYKYLIEVTDLVGLSAQPVTGTISVDRPNTSIISSNDRPDPFIVEQDESTNIEYTLSESDYVTVKIYNENNNIVKTLQQNYEASKGKNSVSWNGKNASGINVKDGTYTYKITVRNDSGEIVDEATGSITVNNSAPKITQLQATPNPFSPDGTNNTSIDFMLSENSYITVKILNKNGDVINVLKDNVFMDSGSNSVQWDGKNSTGNIVSDDVYSYLINAVDLGGAVTSVNQNITVDANNPQITNVSVDPNPFLASENNNCNIAFNLSEDAKVSFDIYKDGVLIKTLLSDKLKQKGENLVVWNGTNQFEKIVGDGEYTYKINAVDRLNNVAKEYTGTIMVDNTNPVVNNMIVDPEIFAPTGSNSASISYNLSENSFVTVLISDRKNNTIKVLQEKTLTKAGVHTLSWDGKNTQGNIVNDNMYKVEVLAVDKVGLKTKGEKSFLVDASSPTIDEISHSSGPFLPTGSNYYDIDCSFSENVSGTIKIYNASGNYIKGISFNDTTYIKWGWNGKDVNGNIVSEGTYTYKINGTDLAGKQLDEVTGTINVLDAIVESVDFTPNPFDPVNNNATISYNLTTDAYVEVKILDYYNETVKTFDDGTLKDSGLNYIAWDGKNTQEETLTDGRYKCIVTATDENDLTSRVETYFKIEYMNPQILDDNVSYQRDTANGSDTYCSIDFKLSEDSYVTLKIYDQNGNLVKTKLSNDLCTGYYSLTKVGWNATDSLGSLVSEGTYTYKINATDLYGKRAEQKSGTINVKTTDDSPDDGQPGEEDPGDTTSPVIDNINISQSPFEPTGDNTLSISYDLSEEANIKASILNDSQQTIKVLEYNVLKSKGTNYLEWDGTNGEGNIVDDGDYTLKIVATDGANNTATETKLISVDGNNPQISNLSVDYQGIPDGSQSFCTINFYLSEDASVTLEIFDQNNNLVLTKLNDYSCIKGNVSVEWDGTNDSGTLVDDGMYTFKVSATDYYGKQSKTAEGTIVVDTTSPKISNVVFTPNLNDPSGTFTYNISETCNVSTVIYDSSDSVVRKLQDNVLKSSGENSVYWDGKDNWDNKIEYGEYTYKITASDLAGNCATPVTGTIALENIDEEVYSEFEAPWEDEDTGDTSSQASSQTENSLITDITVTPELFKPDGIISYTLLKNARVTTIIYNSSGSLIRYLDDDNFKNPGTYNIQWDGKDSVGQEVIDGKYFYKIFVNSSTDDESVTVTGTVVVERYNPSITDVSDSPDPLVLQNSEMNTIEYTLSEKAYVTLKLYNSNGSLIRTLVDSSQSAGLKQAVWNGKDSSGQEVPNGTYTYKINAVDSYDNTSQEITGSITVNDNDQSISIIDEHTSSPEPYDPIGSSGGQNPLTITYKLAQDANVTVSIYTTNDELIEKIYTNSKKSSGTNYATWYGTKSLYSTVSPGKYKYKIKAENDSGYDEVTGNIVVEY